MMDAMTDEAESEVYESIGRPVGGVGCHRLGKWSFCIASHVLSVAT